MVISSTSGLTSGWTNDQIFQNIHLSQYPKYQIMSNSNSLLKKFLKNARDRNSRESKIWTVGFIEMEFDLMGRKFNATTIPAITPFDEWPVEDCKTQEECTGCLV